MLFAVTLSLLVVTVASLFPPAHSLSPQLGADPEVDMNATELITSKGFPCENHYVTTEDGFILNMQRIPHGRGENSSGAVRPAVMLQHGLLGSATNYLDNLANESLAFILADAGADVWLGNVRGNTYSRAHKTLKPSDEKFWAWSFDEMAKYDLPAMIDYIVQTTRQPQVHYVGHSQGTLIGFAGFSQNKTLGQLVKTFIALAPVATVGHIKSPIRLLAPFSKELGAAIELFGHGEFLPSMELTTWFADGVCTDIPLICANVLFVLGGYDFKALNMSRGGIIIIINEMMDLAQTYSKGQSFSNVPLLPDRPIGPEVRSVLQPKYDTIAEFWKQKLVTVPRISLADKTETSQPQMDSYREEKSLTADMYLKLMLFSKTQKLSIFQCLVGLFQLLLSMQSLHENVTILTYIDLRIFSPKISTSVGRCVNFAALTCSLKRLDQMTAAGFLNENSKELDECKENGIFPFGDLEKLTSQENARNMNRNFVIFGDDEVYNKNKGNDFHENFNPTVTEKLLFGQDTELYFDILTRKKSESIVISLNARSDRFTKKRINMVINAYFGLLTDTLQDPDVTITSLSGRPYMTRIRSSKI